MTKDEIVKQEIIERAQNLFQQFGLKKTTMDEIAFACGKAKSTLYHYFKSKEDVFEEVINMEIKNLRLIVKSKVDDVKSVKDKMNAYFITFHKEIINKINLYRTIKTELQGDCHSPVGLSKTSKKFNNFKKFMDFEITYLTRILEDGFDCGEFTKIEREDIPWFSETMIAAFMGVMSYSIETDGKRDQYKMEMTANILINQIFS